MTMIRCNECDGRISDTSVKCIHCGALLKDGHKVISGVGNVIGQQIQFAFVVFVVLIPISLVVQCVSG